MSGTRIIVVKKMIAENFSEFDGHAMVDFFYDEKTGLKGFIAIHRRNHTKPSFGATRLYPYNSEIDALNDALRLSKLMSYKAALAGLPYGGAKGVIIQDKKNLKNRKEILTAYADMIEYLGGRFVTGTDVGLDVKDLAIMQKQTSYVVGMKSDPAAFTGLGIYYGVQSILKELYGNEKITGRSFAVQGLGKVGIELIKLLQKEGGIIAASDVDKKRALEVKKMFPRVRIVDNREIYRQRVDVFSPCALSHSVSMKSMPLFRCKAIVGGANNQLENNHVGDSLHRMGILYAPDYVVNAGGLISVVDEYEHRNHNKARVQKKVSKIKETLASILDTSKKIKRPPYSIADRMAEKIFNGTHIS